MDKGGMTMLTETRYQYLMWLWENETNDEESQEWRGELNADEQALQKNFPGLFATQEKFFGLDAA